MGEPIIIRTCAALVLMAAACASEGRLELPSASVPVVPAVPLMPARDGAAEVLLPAADAGPTDGALAPASLSGRLPSAPPPDAQIDRQASSEQAVAAAAVPAATDASDTVTTGLDLASEPAPEIDAAPPDLPDLVPVAPDGGVSPQDVASEAAIAQEIGGPPLLVDDFSDEQLTSNALGGAVTWDNQDVTLVAGEARFGWNGQGQFQDLLESFRSSWCGFDLTGYRTLRFRLRATTAGQPVRVFLGQAGGGCQTSDNLLLQTIIVDTAGRTFDIDLSALRRERAQFLEWSPARLDQTRYFLDDVQLLR